MTLLELKQSRQRRRRRQESHNFAYLTKEKKSLGTVFFSFGTFRLGIKRFVPSIYISLKSECYVIDHANVTLKEP